jgi:hypothetical protein
MTTFVIPQTLPKPTQNPEPDHPGLERRIGDDPKPLETTASKKVDDISRHESKYDTAPKQNPKLNAREKTQEWTKPGGSKPQGGQLIPGTVKK